MVDRVSLFLEKGEIVGLLGPNGAGKSTTFNMIVGNVTPDAGAIFLNGKSVSKTPMHRRARLGIGYLPQDASVFRRLTVEENILAVLEGRGLSPQQRYEKTERLLDEFNITKLRKSPGYALSGGERRRAEIARCLSIDPDFILLDEPFAGVDPIAVEEIQAIVGQLRDKGYGVLITDHSVRETLRITDRTYIMSDGEILIHGTSQELSENEEARRIYLGKNFRLD
ncbi:ABC transporter ATP-binding protein [Chitinivibrio alkaliphilus ACht1]|uniref:ABC transporter ATP-binding protein n=1 Tax=Chitinivibrio alkaliphilus ACht1 TaxID=1313304 RepID=U7D743_9BACT|nr:ABC transporter ATP-binding protein [Chitinivibrio alkaliphilus ACht1]